MESKKRALYQYNAVKEKRNFSPAIILSIGLVCSMVAFFQIRTFEKKERARLFNIYAQERTGAIRDGLNSELLFVKSVRSLYLSSDSVERDEFTSFVTPILGDSKGVQAIEWAPIVTKEEKELYEKRARDEGISAYSIKELSGTGEIVKPMERDEYCPVYYIEPLKENMKAMGFNLMSNPARKEALEKARDTGQLVVSGRIDLVQDSGHEYGFLAIYPVYKTKDIKDLESRRASISGYVIGVFQYRKLIEHSLENLKIVGINLYVHDKSAPEEEQLVFKRFADDYRGRGNPHKDGLSYYQSLKIGGREWSIECLPTQKFISSVKSWRSFTALIAGAILSLFISVYVMLIMGRTAVVEREVDKRTHALHESENRLKAILEKAVDAIIAIDERGIVEEFNLAAEKMFGFSQNEIIGKNVTLIIPEPNKSGHDKYLSDYLVDGKCHVVDRGREGLAQRKDGSIFPIELSVNSVRLQHRKIYSGIIRDITYRKEIERVKNEFVSVVSHELRTPLTSIRGSLGLLVGGVMGDLPEDVMELLVIARDNTDRLVMLINDILDLEKIESGKMIISPVKTDILGVIKRAADEMAGLAEESGVTLTLVPEKLAVMADADRMLQVLDNLISNAIKFSPKGGEVIISVVEKNDFAIVRIKDSGPGVPDEFKDKVFQKFQQADSTVTRKKGGTGLGLSICKAIVEAHGGETGFESSSAGATFYFSIPMAPNETDIVEQHQPIASPALPDSVYSKKVLIIDDNKDITKLLSMYMEREKYKCYIAHTGNEGFEMAIAHKPDAIILDINLPDISGFEVLKKLKQDPATSDIEVIFLSAQSRESFHHLQVPNVMAWLDKPIDEQKLINSIKSATRDEGPPRVLIVDDDKGLQDVLRLTFEKKGFDVVIASNGKEGAEVFSAVKPDLVILDIMMPEADGFYFVDQLRENPDFYRTPLIVFSAKELSDHERDRLSVKATEFMTKSKTTDEDFFQTTTRILNGIMSKRKI